MDPYNPYQPQSVPRPSDDAKLPAPLTSQPPPEVVVMPPAPASNPTKKWLFITVGIISALLVAGVIVLVVYAYVSNTPNYMLNAAVNNLAKSSGVAADFSFDTVEDSKTSSVKGDFLAYTDPADKQKGAFILGVGQNDTQVGATVRLFSDALYVQPSGLENISRLSKSLGGEEFTLSNAALDALKKLDAQWYSLTSEDAQQLSGEGETSIVKDTITPNDIQTLQRLYAEHPFMVVEQQFGDEKVNNTQSMHLKLGVSAEKLVEYYVAVKTANIKSLNITEQDIADIKKDDTINKTKFEVWISRDNKTFQQTKVLNTDSPDTATFTFKPDRVATQQQSVQKPDGAKSISELINSLFSIFLTSETEQPPTTTTASPAI